MLISEYKKVQSSSGFLRQKFPITSSNSFKSNNTQNKDKLGHYKGYSRSFNC